MARRILSTDLAREHRKFGVLVVDDDKAVRDILSFGLREKGFCVWRASGGRLALNTYWRRRERIDLVLLDVRMPDLDGPQTLIRLRQLSTRFHGCFMSGDMGRETEQTLMALGAVATFRKPLFIDELAAKLMDIVTNPELNPSFRQARKQVIRRRPNSLSGRG